MRVPQFSLWGEKFGRGSGILDLMDDLGVMAGDASAKMLGGGAPALIPEVTEVWRRRVAELCATGEIDRVLGCYDPPAGNHAFLAALAKFLRDHCGWAVSRDNLAVTSGAQNALYMIFGMLAGGRRGGGRGRILLPLAPEYIGYADQGMDEDVFTSRPPLVETLDETFFKYRIDFAGLTLDESVAALALSRPTNPTGNVVSDEELARLSELAKSWDIPLIVDNAYGAPFPRILFVETNYVWEEHHVVTFSLSKLGLPGVRTSFVVARPEIIRALTAANAVLNLANGNVGQAIVRPMLEDGSLARLCQERISPFYRQRRARAVAWVGEAFAGKAPVQIHQPEGGIFLWLRFPGLPIGSDELYRRLKRRRTLVIPGHHFFFGLERPHPHQGECLRVNFAQSETTVREGIQVIAEEVAEAFRQV